MLGNGRAAFHPITTIDVANPKIVVDRRMMDMAADDAVNIVLARIRDQRAFENARAS